MDRHGVRLFAHADRDPSGCLISRYSSGSHGYAQAWDGARVVLAHRLAWVSQFGPIPEGMTVAHLCHVRKCIEPKHLRLLSNLENSRRTLGRNWPIGQCAQGHDAEHWRPKSPERRKGYCAQCSRGHYLRRKGTA